MTDKKVKNSEEYKAGFSSMISEVNNNGKEAARDRFNYDNPIGDKISIFAYGEFQALTESFYPKPFSFEAE